MTANQCRDCKHWWPTERDVSLLQDYHRELPVFDWWVSAPCSKISIALDLDIRGDAYVKAIETDANFSCGLFEAKVG